MEKVYKNNREQVKKILGIEDYTCDILEDYFSDIQSKEISPWLFFPIYISFAIVSSVTTFFKGFKTKLKCQDQELIFFSCPDTVFRTKAFPDMAEGLKFSIVYLPTIHIGKWIEYNNYFKTKAVDAIFWRFSVVDCLKALWRVRSFDRFMSEESKILPEYNKFKQQIYTYALYDELIKRKEKELAFINGKCLLEHQKFFFTPLVFHLRRLGKGTTMLQHGCFFKPTKDYIPLYTDKVICCSERERMHYLDSGVEEKNVFVLGAPLQTIDLSPLKKKAKEYDLLVMLTLINDENVELHKSILKYILENYSDKKVLVRPRPRSRESDLKYIEDLNSFSISPVGQSIKVDLSLAEKVISFSEDALFEIFQAGKQCLLVREACRQDSNTKLRVVDENNMEKEIFHFMSSKDYCTFSANERIRYIGETDFHALKIKFDKIVKEL